LLEIRRVDQDIDRFTAVRAVDISLLQFAHHFEIRCRSSAGGRAHYTTTGVSPPVTGLSVAAATCSDSGVGRLGAAVLQTRNQ
jgi:hypothetical protein